MTAMFSGRKCEVKIKIKRWGREPGGPEWEPRGRLVF